MDEQPPAESVRLEDYNFEQANQQQQQAPSPTTTPASTSYPWSWDMLYVDHPGYRRTINPGWSGPLTIATGAYPPLYKIANGQPGGGWPPAGSQSNGTLPIRICPPVRGNGRLTFRTDFRVRVKNMGGTTGWFCCLFGTTSSSGSPDPNRPLYPYLGVSHDLDNTAFRSVQPGEIVDMNGFRIDIVDNAFAAVPGWPDWAMDANSTPSKLYHCVSPIFYNKGQTILQVSDVFCTSCAV